MFKEGGPHNIKSLGNDEYQMSITLPTDSDGRMARECPNSECSPAYFKVTPGTGITEGQDFAYCPYCRAKHDSNDFTTKEQIRYAKDIMMGEAQAGIDDMIKGALGLNPSGKKKMGGDFLSIEMSYKPGTRAPIRRPYEDEVRRDVICPHCTLDQTVFGLAIWCSDCGNDIFLTHVSSEIAVTRSMIEDITRREEQLGRRVAAKDLENCLEDAVSIFEASAKALVRRALLVRGENPESVDIQMKKVGNSFQSSDRALEQLKRLFQFTPDRNIWEAMGQSFEKRHPVTHNLGVVDRKYLERVNQAELEGREVRITEKEVSTLLENVFSALSEMHIALLA